MKKHPGEIVFKALLYGLDVKTKEGDVWVYIEPDTGGPAVTCLKIDAPDQIMYIPADLTMEDIVKIGNEMPDDELFGLGAGIAMRQIQLENQARRDKVKR